MTHSPFHVVENFISPLQCEELVKQLALRVPDRDEKGAPLKHERLVPVEYGGNVVSELNAIAPLIEQRYGAEIFGESQLVFQQYFENPKVPAEPHCAEGWKFLRKKWTKTKDIDLVGFIWLKDYHASVPLDPRFEVYGGKLEFPAYNFSLTPVRGTLVMFPATPHFVHAMSHVMLGSLEQIKITASLRRGGLPWIYNPASFPGSYQEWFVAD
jgi:hypothetical protein